MGLNHLRAIDKNKGSLFSKGEGTGHSVTCHD